MPYFEVSSVTSLDGGQIRNGHLRRTHHMRYDRDQQFGPYAGPPPAIPKKQSTLSKLEW
jgi:hypothetical protein